MSLSDKHVDLSALFPTLALDELSEKDRASVSAVLDAIRDHSALLDWMIAGCIQRQPQHRAPGRSEPRILTVDVVPLFLHSILASLKSIQALLGNSVSLHVKDCHIITRSLVETIVNTCYILTEGDKAALQAFRHAEQRSFRELNRSANVGEFEIKLFMTNAPKAEDIQGMTDMINEFTSARGREKNWTDLTINERVELIRSKHPKSATLLSISVFWSYRLSSEITHGSLYSILKVLGVYSHKQGHTYADQTTASLVAQQETLLIVIAMALKALADVFSTNFDADVIREVSDSIIAPVVAIFRSHLNGTAEALDG